MTGAGSGGLRITTADSIGYHPGLIVMVGEPGSWSQVYCGPQSALVTPTVAGTSYYVMAFSDVPGPVEADLAITFSSVPPPPTATVTPRAGGGAFRDGHARTRTAYTCANATSGSLTVTLTQTGSGGTVSGTTTTTDVLCSGSTRVAVLDVRPPSGSFVNGAATLKATLFVCGPVSCTTVEKTRTVTLT